MRWPSLAAAKPAAIISAAVAIFTLAATPGNYHEDFARSFGAALATALGRGAIAGLVALLLIALARRFFGGGSWHPR